MLRTMIFVLLVLPKTCFAGSVFEYGGLSLGTDPSTFQQRYPTSIVQGDRTWLSKADSHDDVHFIERIFIDGRKELRIVFEKSSDQLDANPKSWKEDHYARHPVCGVILSRLINRYGQPVRVSQWVEERLNHRVRVWSNSDETMNLDCYNIEGEGKLLAGELTIMSKRASR